MEYLDKFKNQLKQEALDPVGKEDDDIDNDGDVDKADDDNMNIPTLFLESV